MGFLDRLLGRKDPSAAWTADPQRSLEVDLTTSTLCGVGFGQGFRNLSFLGPPDHPWPSREESYKWASRGLDVQGTEKQGIDAIILLWWRGLPPYQGRILWQGKPLAWSASTPRTEIEALFGPAYYVEEGPEPVLYYEYGNVEWQVDFDADGGLNELMLTSQGLYADPEWRKRAGITKPWPPAPGEGCPRHSIG